VGISKTSPYHGIEFETKHVKIIGADGNIIFEDQIEFPKDFDDNAAAIVASRYLCNSAKYRETSIKQMFDRISDTITKWGREQGYFVDDEEASEFNYKLKYYQIHKYFAFNSPVYFNVGIQEKPQSSACFILSVEDNMDSITELGKLEAKIFKKGSGAGSNLSTLRSSKEHVSGGGLASGPVSFLKTHDVLAGVVKSGGTLRRSAKLACLNVDHPDIEEFIECKLFEEEKLTILRKVGVKSRPGYDLSDEVFFQNTNLTVRVTDEFMEKAIIDDGTWSTKFVRDGKICKTYRAKDLLMKIAETSWKIADPGLQFHDTINRWNTLANDGEIVASNPCGEFISLNDTSCNLASINLIKFFSRDENQFVFDCKTFKDVIKTVITAQDILVDNSSYPNKAIETNSKKYRSLGLGYTNLGGLLMWLGIPYDSSLGRSIASCLTALMTGVAYQTSAELAERVGEFEGFQNNKSPMTSVLKQHFMKFRELFDNQSFKEPYLDDIKSACYSVWVEVLRKKKFRNAQTTLLAPTGTISFIMNAVTTGIEPEYSLIRYKRLTGSEGATIKTVNPIVEDSLRNLGYSEDDIPKLVDELLNNNREDSSKTGFKYSEHRQVFLTAARAPGSDLCIDYMGHIKMCAAVQPFISGGISKTINLPSDITTQQIFDLYIEAWKMGLKGVTIYRDGSKNFQPLSTDSSVEPARNINIPTKLVRRKMPDERPAVTHKFRIGGSEGYITCGFYPDTHQLGEIFVKVSKAGLTLNGFADALATVLSIALQYGVPLKDFVRKLSHLKFEPNGFTTNPEIRTAQSIVDYIARYLGMKFLSEEDKIDLGLIQIKNLNGISLETESLMISEHDQDVGAPCPNCGSIMRRLGSCYFCGNCSYNQGSCG